ncbi:polygalacturonase At1g48100 isoform X1 [Macadamia integrifolia]|uniref:polygalacturonase At1g48100 isoform X1 n=1 Tax=Macadamia integrifolia TaxID=60698 RepID=UPI001C4E3AD8|nr:polygalacturonase At1g48100 isoform X1 [Macadamia integrifolia]
MKKVKNLSLLFILLLLIVILIEYSASSVEARKDNKKHQKQKKRPGNNQTAAGPVHSPVPLPASSPYYGPYPTHTNIYDILSFGAKGDGVSDDSKAFVAAWKAACKVPAATVEIPSEFRFLIKPLTLQGPCMPHLVLQIDGSLLAPPKIGSWAKSSLFQWINFKWVHNFTIQGTGTVNGQGSAWWNPSGVNYVQRRSKHIPDLKPTALRFYASYNVNIRDITIINSPGCHLKFDGSGGVKVDNITISSPGDSPNTDGIHLQNAHDVEIKHSNIGCGDDCVSIQTGCSNVHVHHVNCGPGHGVSLGGLGKDKTVACVSGIVIENINIQNALSGVRIKTWQGGMGSVKNVSFSNIEVTDVEVPIMIDQYYCDRRFCKNQTEAVAITGVKYNQITGTYSLQPIHLACSNNVPCIDVDLIDIQLEPSPGSNGFQQALCWNSYGKSQAPLVPSAMDYCLRRGGSWAKRPAGSHDHSC